jgi:hypothetical protein
MKRGRNGDEDYEEREDFHFVLKAAVQASGSERLFPKHMRDALSRTLDDGATG